MDCAVRRIGSGAAMTLSVSGRIDAGGQRRRRNDGMAIQWKARHNIEIPETIKIPMIRY